MKSATPTTAFRLAPLCAVLLAAFPAAAEAGIAGRFQFVAGDVRVIEASGRERTAQKGDNLNEGEVVLSALNASAQVKMIDGGFIAIRPDSRVKVDTYRYAGKEDGTEKSLFSILKGGFRAITGAIGRSNRENYKIATPSATIGIRGTDHEPVVVLPPPPGMDAPVPPGTYDKVNVGGAYLENTQGIADAGPNTVIFAAGPDVKPTILPTIPPIYTTTPTVRDKGAKKEDKKEQAAQRDEKQGQKKEDGKEQNTAGTTTSTSTESTTATTSDATMEPIRALTATDTSLLNQPQPAATTTDPAPAAVTATTSATTNTLANQINQTVTALQTKPAYAPGAFIATGWSGYYADTSSPLNSPYFSDSGAGLTLTRNPDGQVTGFASSHAGSDGSTWSNSVSYSGGTAADFGLAAASGMSWGRWVGGTVYQSNQYDYSNSTASGGSASVIIYGQANMGSYSSLYELGSGSAHWITGTAAEPGYLGMVLTGSASYSKIGGTRPTDNRGNVGTLNSAFLNVNFTTQTANVGVNFTVDNNTWAMAAAPSLREGNRFQAITNGVTTPPHSFPPSSSPLTSFTKNSQDILNSSDIWGVMDGTLLGTGLDSAALRYHVGENVPATTAPTQNAYDGVVAFSGPAQDILTPYRGVMLMSPDYGFTTAIVGNYGPANNQYDMWGDKGTIAPAASVVTDSTGALQSFTTQGAGYQASGATVWTDQVVTIARGTAVANNVGLDAATGISWGRWDDGALEVSSLGGTVLGTMPNSSKVHWIASGTMTAPPTLPLTGIYAYNLAGNTNPTDSLGNVGTLNALTLNANFSAMTVDAAAQVTINDRNWALNAAAMPIKGGEFLGISGVTTAPVTVSCTGCTGTVSGGISGHFMGDGAPAVGIGYRMVETSAASVGNTITGVAVMKR